ncbi:unnamed protein product [Schistosoma margrebowiei]|uniref:Uncharacterized protein n=1 Tax=Schistosoma margrebowiei TaxID=48269 RepID=A0A183MUX1_9TREM|nr:unnamed protein product [Schistosoma margrebowiei]
MVVGGSQQETLDPGFVLFGTRQQGVPVILRELVLPGGPLSYPSRQGAPVPSRLQVHLADECQIARNPGPGFPVDYLQPPSKISIHSAAVSSHLDWWPHCNMIDSIRSALIRTRQA